MAGCEACSTEDTTAPVITLLGDNPVLLDFGEEYVEAGATVTDDVDMNLTAVVTGTVDSEAVGSYTLTYNAADSSGNIATPVTRTVDVLDTVAPVITLLGDNPMIVEQGETFTDPGATVTDNVDTDLTVTVTGEVDVNTLGTYTLTYDATDSAGNVSESLSRSVEVVYSGQLVITPSGTDLLLLGIDGAGALSERGRASLDGLTHYNTNHHIFSVTKHPLENTVYVTSFNECGSGYRDTDGCWGNGRIDRFSYDANSINYEGIAYLAQFPLRIYPPSFDESTSELSMDFVNQSAENVEIETVELTIFKETDPSTIDSACNGETLAPGDSCTVVITNTKRPVADELIVTTAEQKYRTRTDLRSDEDDVEYYIVYQLSVDGAGGEESRAVLTHPTCFNEGWSVNQAGYCATTAMTFSEDGTRAFVNEDGDDVALSFSVNTDGNLTFLAQSSSSSSVSLQGIAVHPDNSVLYNGSNSYTVTDDAIIQHEWEGEDIEGGNATEVVRNSSGKSRLISTLSNEALGIYDIETNPLTPRLISSVDISDLTDDSIRFQDHSDDLGIIAVVGPSSLSTWSYDGATLTNLDTLDTEVEFTDCKDDCDYQVMSRGVQVTGDGSWAVVSTFVNVWDDESLATVPYLGSTAVYSIDATTGELLEVSKLPLAGLSRALLMVDTPE